MNNAPFRVGTPHVPDNFHNNNMYTVCINQHESQTKLSRASTHTPILGSCRLVNCLFCFRMNYCRLWFTMLPSETLSIGYEVARNASGTHTHAFYVRFLSRFIFCDSVWKCNLATEWNWKRAHVGGRWTLTGDWHLFFNFVRNAGLCISQTTLSVICLFSIASAFSKHAASAVWWLCSNRNPLKGGTRISSRT